MDIPKKSIAAFVAVILIAGSAMSLSGVNLLGDFVSAKVPDWCIKNPFYQPYSPEGGSYTPPTTKGIGRADLVPGYSWRFDKPGSITPGSLTKPDISRQLQNPLKDITYKKVKDLDKPLTSEIGGSSTSGGRSGGGQDTIRKGGSGVTIPGVTIPGVPGGSTPGGNTPSQEAKNTDPYWSYKIVCPNGYQPDHDLFESTCPRIKKLLEGGLFTEATLPPDMKKLLPLCNRFGSWFSVPKMSDTDCESLFAAQMSGVNVDPSKMEYCWKMKNPDMYSKTYTKLNDQCVNAKKNGGPLPPEVKKFCENSIWWWKMVNTPSKDECKKISSAMSDYKNAGGEYCELPSGDTSSYCSLVYPETMPADYAPCGMGG